MNNTFTDDKVNTSFCPEDNACIIPSINPEDNTCISPKGIIYNCSIDPKGNITGFTEDHVKALYNPNKNKWFFGSGIGSNNLISLRERTESEKKEIRGKALESYRKNLEEKRDFNNLAKAMLDQILSDRQIKDIVGDNDNFMIDNTLGGALLNAMMNSALKGSFKAFEAVRDTAGYKPKNEVELQADIMTEADKSLIDKALKTG